MHPTQSESMTTLLRSSAWSGSRNSSRFCASSKKRSRRRTHHPVRARVRRPARLRPAALVEAVHVMSLYGVQKLIFQLNRDRATRKRYEQNFDELLRDFELSEEERQAIRTPDIG